jgi:pseudaminic acid cytidylyltransferase
MSSICVIPARGNSQRLRHKNIMPLDGVPVIAHPIRVAQRSGLFDEIIVSTDDEGIGAHAHRYGTDVWRRAPDDGTRGTQEVAAEVLRRIPRAHIACVIYPTAALVTADMLIQAYAQLARGIRKFVFAVGAEPLRDAGAFYAGWAQAFRDGLPLVANGHQIILPEAMVCDVNTADDWDELERKYWALKEKI